MGRKKKADAEQADAVTTTETPSETAVEPAPGESNPKKDKKKTTSLPPATLAEIAAGYLAYMREQGKSDGTIASYGMELRVAMDELGAETPGRDLTPEQVEKFYNCKRVTKLRSGKAKAKPSIDKTRRVLRLALRWAMGVGFISIAPLPKSDFAE